MGGFVIRRLGFDTVYMCPKFNNSSFSRSRDITGAPKFKVDQVILTMPPLRVITGSMATQVFRLLMGRFLG